MHWICSCILYRINNKIVYLKLVGVSEVALRGFAEENTKVTKGIMYNLALLLIRFSLVQDYRLLNLFYCNTIATPT